jgi:hypothetical protein
MPNKIWHLLLTTSFLFFCHPMELTSLQGPTGSGVYFSDPTDETATPYTYKICTYANILTGI